MSRMDRERPSSEGDASGETSRAGVYSMGAVVRMLGIPAATLRTWEDRYAVVLPHRSAGGHRLYSRDQIDQLSFVRDEVERGASPADAFRLLDAKMVDYAKGQPARDVSVLIILAERDEFAAEFSEYFLRTEGYDCLVVMDPEKVIEHFAERTPS